MNVKERKIIRLQNLYISIDFTYEKFLNSLFNYKDNLTNNNQKKLLKDSEDLIERIKKLKKELKNTYIKEEK